MVIRDLKGTQTTTKLHNNQLTGLFRCYGVAGEMNHT